MIFTSYFSNPLLRRIPPSRQVAISVGVPRNWYGMRCLELAPTRAMLKMESRRYDALYAEILARQDPQTTGARFEGCVLLCWERRKEECHRWTVAQWLMAAGFEVEELTAESRLTVGQQTLNL